MSAIYLEFTFEVQPLQPTTEILIAELGYAGFESFIETETGVVAYIQKEEWNDNLLEDVQILSNENFEITYSYSEIIQVNWNAEWEKNFSPIVVNDECAVRAPFHAAFNVPFEIIIEPKMSFGTGHHETTFMMLQYILEGNFKGKTVLDMGCGTAVLAILAKMKGAINLDAIDIDEWCVENSKENIVRNNCEDISVYLGDVTAIPEAKKYDVIIANINRNILLNDMPNYVEALEKSGTLYLSGFYKVDLESIKNACTKLQLNFVDHKVKNEWVAAKFVNL